MLLTASCRTCGSRTTTLPHVCRNQLCAKLGHRVGSEFTPSKPDVDHVVRLPLAQFAIRHWFQLIALLAAVFVAVHYLGPAMFIGAPLLLCAFDYTKWRGLMAAFVDAILAVYAIIFITVTVIIAVVVW